MPCFNEYFLPLFEFADSIKLRENPFLTPNECHLHGYFILTF